MIPSQKRRRILIEDSVSPRDDINDTLDHNTKRKYIAVQNGIFHRREDAEKFLDPNGMSGNLQHEQKILVCGSLEKAAEYAFSKTQSCDDNVQIKSSGENEFELGNACLHNDDQNQQQQQKSSFEDLPDECMVHVISFMCVIDSSEKSTYASEYMHEYVEEDFTDGYGDLFNFMDGYKVHGFVNAFGFTSKRMRKRCFSLISSRQIRFCLNVCDQNIRLNLRMIIWLKEVRANIREVRFCFTNRLSREVLDIFYFLLDELLGKEAKVESIIFGISKKSQDFQVLKTFLPLLTKFTDTLVCLEIHSNSLGEDHKLHRDSWSAVSNRRNEEINKHLRCLQKMPNLRCFALRHLGTIPLTINLESLLSVESLEFFGTNFVMKAYMPKLRNLVCSVNCDNSDSMNGLVHILKTCSVSIKKLYLLLGEESSEWGGFNNLENAIEALSQLQDLKIFSELLYLPGETTKLRVSSSSLQRLSVLGELVCDVRCPYLKRIDCEFHRQGEICSASLRKYCSNLKTISISIHERFVCDDFFKAVSALPKLEHLLIQGDKGMAVLPNIEVTSSSLNSLVLENCSMFTCACPKLKALRIKGDVALLRAPDHFRSLQHLEFELPNKSLSLEDMENWITLIPKLKYLSILKKGGADIEQKNIPSIKSKSVEEISIMGQQLHVLECNCPSLRKLSINNRNILQSEDAQEMPFNLTFRAREYVNPKMRVPDSCIIQIKEI